MAAIWAVAAMNGSMAALLRQSAIPLRIHPDLGWAQILKIEVVPDVHVVGDLQRPPGATARHIPISARSDAAVAAFPSSRAATLPCQIFEGVRHVRPIHG
jgi:hypothetical protein